jgi:hypothetical protein
MISTFTALIDANVFYGTRLRSLVLFLAQTGTFRARWTDRIHNEWIAAVARNRPDLNSTALQRTRELMDAAVLDCLVRDYEQLAEAVHLPDEDDKHVLAAAIAARASVIVTFNLKDFPDEVLRRFGLHAKHPDEFMMDLESIDPEAFVEAVRDDFSHYRRPPITVERYAEDLRKAGVPMVAAHIAALKVLITP